MGKGEKITVQNGVLTVPDYPIIPFIIGDGTGPDIWRAASRVLDAAVEKAGELCGRMRGGEVEASPYEDSAGSVCRYGDYSAVCRAGKQKVRKRKEDISWDEIAGKNTLRESEK